MNRIYTLCLILCLKTIVGVSQQLEWAQTLPILTSDIIADDSGSIFRSGWIWGTVVDVDPGPGTYYINTVTDGAKILQKLDSNGNLVWVKSFKGGYSVSKLAFDTSGNIIMAGWFSDTIFVDTGMGTQSFISHGGRDCFVFKMDASGNTTWAISFGGTMDDHLNSVCTDANNNIYCTGTFKDTVDFDPGPGTFNINTLGPVPTNGYLLKLNSDGIFQFAKDYGSSKSYQSVVYDPRGYIFLSGSYYTTGIISKIDTSGNSISVKQFGESPTDVAIDKDYNFIAVGHYQDSLDYDPGPGYHPLPGAQYYNLYVLKLDSAGNFQWAYGFGGSGNVLRPFVTIDTNNIIYVSGYFEGTFDVDPGPGITNISSQNSKGHFVLKYSSTGDLLQAFQFTNIVWNGEDFITGDQKNNIYTSARFQGITDVDPGPNNYLINSYYGDFTFLIKLSPDTCLNLAVIVDSVMQLTCQNPGYGVATAINGTPPYQYSWNTVPVTSDSLAIFTQPGIYSASVMDNNGCSRSSSTIVSSFQYLNQFDLEVFMVSPPFVPGQNTLVTLNGINNGCIPVSGSIHLNIDTSTTFISSVPPPAGIIGDSVYWNFSNLVNGGNPFEINVVLVSDSSLQVSQDVCFRAGISPYAGDADTTNNSKNYCFDVRTAFDPNDKKVYPAGKCTDGYVLKNQVLTYTIHFQNTGDTTAFNTSILDSIDASLNINSLRVIAASHDYVTEVFPGNFLKFRFDNINLPDSAADWQGSNGYIIYQVNADSLVPNGTPVNNKAYILMDYNDPVVTNNVLNTLVNAIPVDTSVAVIGTTLLSLALGANYQWLNCVSNTIISGATSQMFIPSSSGNYAVIVSQGGCVDTSSCYQIVIAGMSYVDDRGEIQVYPNPVKENVTIKLSHLSRSCEIRIMDITGNTLFQETKNNTDNIPVNLIHFANGIYFLKVQGDSFSSTIKVIVLNN